MTTTEPGLADILNPTQLRIIALDIGLHTNLDIALVLGCSLHNVKYHKRAVIDATGLPWDDVRLAYVGEGLAPEWKAAKRPV